VVKAEEVESLGASSELHDPGLLGRKTQPELGQDRRHQLAGRSACSRVAQRTTRSSA
jgi:hypothetical protein